MTFGLSAAALGAVAVGGATLASGYMQSRAAGKAADIQGQAAQSGIEEQRRQFDEIQKLLSPYVGAGQQAISGFQPFQQAGAQAFEQQQALAGLRGPEAQQAAIAQIEQSPFLQAQIRQGEEAMLQRASATGGLRGGNIQAALAQFRPQMLQQAIEQQYGRLGGFAGAGLGITEQLYRGGQASAANQASAAGAMGSNVANLLQQQGAAQAGGALGRTSPFAQLGQLPLQLASMNYARTGQFGLPGNIFGGSSQPVVSTAYDFGVDQAFSDRRLKTDITRLSTRSDGLGVYRFRYVWGGPLHIGLMAQEVQPLYPAAVLQRDGYLMVDYGRVPGG